MFYWLIVGFAIAVLFAFVVRLVSDWRYERELRKEEDEDD